jgi:hypothetical protein
MDNNLVFFAEPGNITIETSLDSYITSAKVSGSKMKRRTKKRTKTPNFRPV